MNTIVIGSAGQLGTDLMRQLPEAVGLTHQQIDITSREEIEDVFKDLNVGCVINTAAYNLVDAAEENPEPAFAVNAFGARNLAQWCGVHEIPLLHVSTDHVFGDAEQGTPLKETDCPLPNSVYAASKLTGEFFVRAECPQHFIVRTCGLFGKTATRAKGNFVNTMLRLGTERDELRVVSDQHCTPTSTADLAGAIVQLVNTTEFGTYHATNSGATTWYEFALEIFRLAEIDVEVVPISTAEFNADAHRPPYSVLDCAKLTQTIGFELPSWKDALSAYLESRG